MPTATATETSEPTAGPDCFTFQAYSWREAASIVATAGNLCCDAEPFLDYERDATLIHGLRDWNLGAPVSPLFTVTGDQGEQITCRAFATGIVAIRPAPAHCVGYGVIAWDRVVNAEPPTPTVTPTRADTWSYLFVADGDNDLAYYVHRAFSKLEDEPAPLPFYGIVDYNGANDTQFFGPDGEISIGERNMGWEQTLATTLAWSEPYRTRYGVLHLFNHGSADGLLYDDTSGRDYLTPGELARALDGQHFDVLFVEACLGANIELLYTLAPFADYIIASETLGWSILATERYVAVEGDARARAIGIAEQYFLHEKLDGYPRTISVVDTSQIEPVLDAISELAVCDLEHARQIVQHVDSDQPYYQIDDDDRLVDLYELLYVCGIPTTALDPFIVVSLHESGEMMDRQQQLEGCYGVSIYVPAEIDRRARDHAYAYASFYERVGDILTRIPGASDIEATMAGGEVVVPPMGLTLD